MQNPAETLRELLRNDRDKALLLIRTDPETYEFGDNGAHLLTLAAALGLAPIIDEILPHCPETEENTFGSPLFRAINNNHPAAIRSLLKAKWSNSILSEAAQEATKADRADCLAELVSLDSIKGACADLLHLAIQNGSGRCAELLSGFAETAPEGYFTIIDAILSQRPSEQETAKALAALAGLPEPWLGRAAGACARAPQQPLASLLAPYMNQDDLLACATRLAFPSTREGLFRGTTLYLELRCSPEGQMAALDIARRMTPPCLAQFCETLLDTGAAWLLRKTYALANDPMTRAKIMPACLAAYGKDEKYPMTPDEQLDFEAFLAERKPEDLKGSCLGSLRSLCLSPATGHNLAVAIHRLGIQIDQENALEIIGSMLDDPHGGSHDGRVLLDKVLALRDAAKIPAYALAMHCFSGGDNRASPHMARFLFPALDTQQRIDLLRDCCIFDDYPGSEQLIAECVREIAWTEQNSTSLLKLLKNDCDCTGDCTEDRIELLREQIEHAMRIQKERSDLDIAASPAAAAARPGNAKL